MGFEVLTAMLMKIQFFWDITLWVECLTFEYYTWWYIKYLLGFKGLIDSKLHVDTHTHTSHVDAIRLL
jgi:hypothetical protein